jgi:tetratricopeptide (TPR) repeat protein
MRHKIALAAKEGVTSLSQTSSEVPMNAHAETLIIHARALVQQGQPDEAIRHLEQAQALLPQGREQAIVLGEIARIKVQTGEVDDALLLHQEEMAIYEALEDLDGTANALWSIARIEVQQRKWQEAFDHLSRSYAINLRLGRLDGICTVGVDLGLLLCASGQREEGLKILTLSRDGFLQLGRPGYTEQVQQLITQSEKGDVISLQTSKPEPGV